MIIDYNTNAVRDHDQFDYWRDAICNSYVKLNCNSSHRHKFNGRIRLQRMSNLDLSFIAAESQIVHRRKTDIAKSTDEFFLLSLQLLNEGVIEQQGRRAELKPNDFALYDSTLPYSLKFDDRFDQLVIRIPRTDLLLRLPNADNLTSRRVSGSEGLGQMIANHIKQFSNIVQEQDEAAQSFIQENLIDLVATGLSSVQKTELILSNPELLLLQRAKSFTVNNLRNPYLDRKMVSNFAGVSVRHLSSIFAKNDISIAAYIRNSRLDKIAYELRDIRFNRQSISEIAMKWGINNLQHFSKIFKDRFKMSARDYRNNYRLN